LTNPPDRITAPLSQDEIRSSSPSWNTVVIDQVVFLHTDLGLDMEGNAKIAVRFQMLLNIINFICWIVLPFS